MIEIWRIREILQFSVDFFWEVGRQYLLVRFFCRNREMFYVRVNIFGEVGNLYQRYLENESDILVRSRYIWELKYFRLEWI